MIVNIKDAWKGFVRNKGAVFGLCFITFLITMAIAANVVTQNGPMDTAAGHPFEHPSRLLLMGTDDLGRDIFAGVIYGSRVSLLVGCIASATATLIGVIIGSIAGYFGGLVDEALMRVCELFQSMPRFLFALVIVVFFGNNMWNVVIVIGILSWPRIGRLVRSEFLRLRTTDFVLAAKAIGTRNFKIIFKHILPNVLHIIFVTASLEVGAAIITEAALSYLGASDPNLMSWGRMLYNAQRFLRTAWWLSVFPGLAIFLTVLSFNLIGDGINDAFNPRLRGIHTT